jgi:hypothetical protein
VTAVSSAVVQPTGRSVTTDIIASIAGWFVAAFVCRENTLPARGQIASLCGVAVAALLPIRARAVALEVDAASPASVVPAVPGEQAFSALLLFRMAGKLIAKRL